MVRLWNEARLALYTTLRKRLPASTRDWIGGSTLTAPLRRMLLWPSAVGKLVDNDVTFGGHRFRFRCPVKVASHVRLHGGIENGLCRLILQECKPGGVALDVGANYGFVSLVMAHAVGPAGQVHSFEADPVIYRAFVANLESNSLADRCAAVHGFVGDIAQPPERVTIDQYVADTGVERVDFLKIDVDGPDLEVLLGARRTLERFHPVIAIEMTGEQARIVELLHELGYECTDMRGIDIDPSAWPPNILAAVGRRLAVPPRPVA